MESEGVSLPWIHEHLMMPWNDLRKGDCCGHIQGISDGYYCQSCDFFVHKKCSDEAAESIEHPSHSAHTLQLQSKPGGSNSCDLCGQYILHLCYRCEMCDFDVDLHCAKYPPREVIETSVTHGHKLTLLKEEIEFDCDANCGKAGDGFPYKCCQCDLSFHVDCVSVIKHPSKDSKEGVSLPLIHEHFMVPWNDLRKGDCCGGLEPISDGYYCRSCDFFSHKKCGDEASEYIQHPSHSIHTLRLQRGGYYGCGLCGRVSTLTYRCHICDFDIDLYCARYPPPQVMDVPETHRHKLTLVNKLVDFECAAKCGKTDAGFSYRCDECDVAFHVDCVWHPATELKHPAEVNHSHHSLHPLKLLMGKPPDYSDGQCRLCGRTVDKLFYHCSSCDFTLDMRCVLYPPPLSFSELKTHHHQLFLLPRLIIFMCNACGLKGDRSPYMCVQCDFVIHQDCLGLPRVININRHDHRVSRTSLLGVVNSVCGVCRKKVDWTCGGFSCQRCIGYVVHSKCATRKDVWNGKELEGVPEEEEDVESYVVIDDNTIHHFSHKEHYLRLHVNGTLYEENKRCNACIHPIGLGSFYACIMECDFILHQNCARFPRKKRHLLHNEQLTLVTGTASFSFCDACSRMFNGFMYTHGYKTLEILCGSISEPFDHPSHHSHPLYCVSPNGKEICDGCNLERSQVLRCIEDGCQFSLCFECATLPQVVKHRVHDDHPLSLCYGEEEASGKYWCDICEKETNPKTWFYTCKDHRASLHIKCVVGEFAGFMPRSTVEVWGNSYEVVLNNSMSRPFCRFCKSRCTYPIILKQLGTSDAYMCSRMCLTREVMI